MAFVFSNTDNELYPYLADDASSGSSPNTPLSPDDQALLMGMYPGANLTDFDFSLVGPTGLQQHHGGGTNMLHDGVNMNVNTGLNMLDSSGSASALASASHLMPPPLHTSTGAATSSTAYNTGYYQQQSPSPSPAVTPASSTSSSKSPQRTSASNSAKTMDRSLKDSEAILNAPVKSLTEEEKKLRRRAQVAKSARKHRNRQKEELAHLREQVRQLQDQMEVMHMQHAAQVQLEANGESANGKNPSRKRKKMDDDETSELEQSLVQPVVAAPSETSQALVKPVLIQHFYNHLTADVEQRMNTIRQIVNRRLQLWRPFVHGQFSSQSMQLPHMDIKLNSNGEDVEVKLVSAKSVENFTHQELAEAAWGSIFNFQVEVPAPLRKHVTVEKLVDLDENTRYGRTIAPLLKNREENYVVYMHSYFVLHREIRDDYSLLTWETVAEDDLFHFEQSPRHVRNNEVGCALLETGTLPDGGVQTFFRSVIHSTPPVDAINQPRGRLTEAFLTVFCRNADILESSARLYMLQKHPERFPAKVHRGIEYVKSEDGDTSPKADPQTL